MAPPFLSDTQCRGPVAPVIGLCKWIWSVMTPDAVLDVDSRRARHRWHGQSPASGVGEGPFSPVVTKTSFQPALPGGNREHGSRPIPPCLLCPHPTLVVTVRDRPEPGIGYARPTETGTSKQDGRSWPRRRAKLISEPGTSACVTSITCRSRVSMCRFFLKLRSRSACDEGKESVRKDAAACPAASECASGKVRAIHVARHVRDCEQRPA